MKLEFRLTPLGFNRAEFLDRYGFSCSIQESSTDQPDVCLWLGRHQMSERMLLTKEMVKALLPALEEFVATGKVGRESTLAEKVIDIATNLPEVPVDTYLAEATRWLRAHFELVANGPIGDNISIDLANLLRRTACSAIVEERKRAAVLAESAPQPTTLINHLDQKVSELTEELADMTRHRDHVLSELDKANSTIAKLSSRLEIYRTSYVAAEFLHTEECLQYAAKTHKGYCIDQCAQARRKRLEALGFAESTFRTRRCAAVSLIERDDGHILCVWNTRYEGWSLPGGMVEIDETVEEAQARELAEETGLGTHTATRVYEGAHGITAVNGARSGRASVVVVFRVHPAGQPQQMEKDSPIIYLSREQFLRLSPFASFYEKVFAAVPPFFGRLAFSDPSRPLGMPRVNDSAPDDVGVES